MAKKRILILQGHPDPRGGRFGHALADAYAQGATAAGNEVRTITIARLRFPLLRTQDEFEKGRPPADIVAAQQSIRWAQHVVLFFPLWLGTMPSLVKAFLEQVFRPGFAMDAGADGRFPRKLLKGRSARIVVTMGMPGVIYKWFFQAHGLRGLESSIFAFSGFRPIRDTIVGMVASPSAKRREQWLEEMTALGEEAE